MKVLLVNCVYKVGSTGKIIFDLRRGLEKLGCEVCVAYSRGAKNNDDQTYRLCSVPIMLAQSITSKITGYSYANSFFSTFELKKLIRQWKPDIVNLHCVNANTINIAGTIMWLKKHSIPTVISEHAEFMHTGGCGHALDCNKWITGCSECPQFHERDTNLPKSYFFDRTKEYWNSLAQSFSGFTNMVATGVSPWLTNRMKKSPFFSDKLVVPILNGLDTSIFTKRDPINIGYYNNLFQGKDVILHVTPNFYSPIKGGKYVIEIALRLKETRKNAIICIIGYNGDGNDLPANIIPISFTKNQKELAEMYSRAKVCLLTSEKETFSMVTAEALCCGTPVVGFKAGGPESIALTDYSLFCDYGDVVSLVKNIEYFLDNPQDSEIISRDASTRYSTQTMANNYFKVYQNLINK